MEAEICDETGNTEAFLDNVLAIESMKKRGTEESYAAQNNQEQIETADLGHGAYVLCIFDIKSTRHALE